MAASTLVDEASAQQFPYWLLRVGQQLVQIRLSDHVICGDAKSAMLKHVVYMSKALLYLPPKAPGVVLQTRTLQQTQFRLSH